MAATPISVTCTYVPEFALYFAMEERNLGDMCSRSKQTETLLNVWRGKDVTGL